MADDEPDMWTSYFGGNEYVLAKRDNSERLREEYNKTCDTVIREGHIGEHPPPDYGYGDRPESCISVMTAIQEDASSKMSSKITSITVLVIGDEHIGKRSFLRNVGFVDNKKTFTLENGGTIDVTVVVTTTRRVCSVGPECEYDCVLGMFDLTNFETLPHLTNALDRHIAYKKLVICGTKHDLTSKRKVQITHIISRITRPYGYLGVKYFDVSTLTGYNLQKPFQEIMSRYLKDPKLAVAATSEDAFPKVTKVTSFAVGQGSSSSRPTITVARLIVN